MTQSVMAACSLGENSKIERRPSSVPVSSFGQRGRGSNPRESIWEVGKRQSPSQSTQLQVRILPSQFPHLLRRFSGADGSVTRPCLALEEGLR